MPHLGAFSWAVPVEQALRALAVTANAVDGGTPGFRAPTTATVHVSAANRAPVLAPVTVSSFFEGNEISIQIMATDPDGDSIIYSLAPGAPAGSAIDPTTGQFTWAKPTLGIHYVTVIATDNGTPPLAGSERFPLVVSNLRPTISLGSNLPVQPYEVFAQAGSFSDPSGGPFVATVDYGDGTGSQSLALSQDMAFMLAHSYVKSGQYVVNVAVADQFGATGSTRTIVTVEAPAPTGFGPWRDSFVRALYLGNLNRDPAPPDLRFWSRQLSIGSKPGTVALKVWSSPEHRALVANHVLPPVGFNRALADAYKTTRRLLANPHAVRVSTQGP
jgi:hypothetical protein